jgi:hypothetical protein
MVQQNMPPESSASRRRSAPALVSYSLTLLGMHGGERPLVGLACRTLGCFYGTLPKVLWHNRV